MSKYRVIEVTDYDGTFYQIEKKGWFRWNIIYKIVHEYLEWPMTFKTLEEAKTYVDRLAYKKQREVVYECGED